MRRLAVLLCAVSVLVVVGFAEPPDPSPNIKAEVTRVIDGDTIEAVLILVPDELSDELATWTKVTIRYIGIDTPETKHPTKPVERMGPEASNYNTTLVGGKIVYLELDKELWGPYDRLLAYVYLDSQGRFFVNALLVAAGLAEVTIYPPNDRYADILRTLESAAKTAGIGIWREPCPVCPECGGESDSGGEEACIEFFQFHYDADGDDRYNPNDEYFTIRNCGSAPVNMTGWVVRDKAGHTFHFPDAFILAPNATVTIYTGPGVNSESALYWGLSNKAVWNNDGDVATIYDQTGQVIASYSY